MKTETTQKEVKGITLIALVITIVVLLILAGVTIATLTGENGLLSKAQEAKESSESAEMGDKIQTAILAAKANPEGELTKEGIEEELQKEFKDEDIEAIVAGKSFIIKIGDKLYKSNGKLVEVSEIEYAGDLSKGGAYDGLVEATAYRINCIEDLVEWTNNYSTYSSKCIKLERTLDFEDPNSYSDFMNVVTNDINGDGKKEYIITELTTGTGFKPIEGFSGIFDGQANEIRNIYENTTGNAGLFGGVHSLTVKNLGIKGKITSINGYAGAIAGKVLAYNDITNLENCFFDGNVSAYNIAGGILGEANQARGNNKIDSCYNLGTIESAVGTSAGIVGCTRIATITNCYNKGNIIGLSDGAGILGHSNGTPCIYNCYNKGSIKAESRVGGISGYIYNDLKVKNSYNIGNLEGEIIGGIASKSMWSNPNIIFENCFYIDTCAKKGINNCKDTNVAYTRLQIFNESFVDELNNYITDNTEDAQEWLKWKQSEEGYPTFNKEI